MIGLNGQPLRTGKARVIRTGPDVTERPTVPIRYTRDEDADTWYAELRAKQAVR